LTFILLVLIHDKLVAQDGWFWQKPLPQGNSLSAVKVFDENTAIVVGSAGTIMKTSNGGKGNYLKNSFM